MITENFLVCMKRIISHFFCSLDKGDGKVSSSWSHSWYFISENDSHSNALVNYGGYQRIPINTSHYLNDRVIIILNDIIRNITKLLSLFMFTNPPIKNPQNNIFTVLRSFVAQNRKFQSNVSVRSVLSASRVRYLGPETPVSHVVYSLWQNVNKEFKINPIFQLVSFLIFYIWKC